MLIKRPVRGSHWYSKDGKPVYEVPKADGNGMRSTNIRDAFKMGLYRSVTNVLGIVSKPGLDNWKVEQGILAALTLPQVEGEPLQDFAHRAADDAEKQSIMAADEGTRLHDLAADYLKNNKIPVHGRDEELLRPFFNWVDQNVERVVASEEVVLNHEWCYAGRLDAAVILKDGTGTILDIKTQEVKSSAKGEPKPDFYDEWPLQLAAYSRCGIGFFGSHHPWRLFSGVLGRKDPGFFPKEWTDPADPVKSSQSFYTAFCHACALWSHLKGGTPGAPK